MEPALWKTPAEFNRKKYITDFESLLGIFLPLKRFWGFCTGFLEVCPHTFLWTLLHSYLLHFTTLFHADMQTETTENTFTHPPPSTANPPRSPRLQRGVTWQLPQRCQPAAAGRKAAEPGWREIKPAFR